MAIFFKALFFFTVYLFIFYTLYKRFIPNKYRTIFVIHYIISLLTLLVANQIIKNHNNYPAIYDDGLRYHVIGEQVSNSSRFSISSEQLLLDNSNNNSNNHHGRESITETGSFSPGWSVFIIGTIYKVFGVNPLYIKLVNILMFQLCGLLIIYTAGQYGNVEKYIKIFVILFLYYPLNMVNSVSMLKEIYVSLLILISIYSMTKKEKVLYVLVSISLLLLTRPYYGVILFSVLVFQNIGYRSKRNIIIALPVIVIFLNIINSSSNYSFEYLMFQIDLPIRVGRTIVWIEGGWGLVKLIFRQPINIIISIFYGLITTFLHPNPWNLNLVLNSTEIDQKFASYSTYLSSYIWYYYIYKLIPYYIVIIKTFKKEILKNHIFQFLFIATIFNGIYAQSTRYKSSIESIIIIYIIYLMSEKYYSSVGNYKNKLASILIIMIFALIDIVVWGQTSLI
jgi:hypothetical protein